MKLKKIKIKNYNLIRLYLIKYNILGKKLNSSLLCENTLDKLEINFKKNLFLINQYHIHNKKILFVGLPHSNDKKLLNILTSSNHYFIPEFIWANGLISNKQSVFTLIKSSSSLNSLLKIKENPDLIVFCNYSSQTPVMLEASKLDIPMVSFGALSHNFIKNKLYFFICSILKK